MEAQKIIVTNRSALNRKYKTNLEKILALLEQMIAADQERGIDTSLIFLDDMQQMKTVRGAAVTRADDQQQNVTAIQKIFSARKPDYLLLFGGPDVIPMIEIKNPVFNEFDIPDTNRKDPEDGPFIWSDLPYACDVPYTQDYKKYMQTTTSNQIRVVGRMPDIVDSGRVSFISKLVNHSTSWEAKNGTAGKAFVLSTTDWSDITKDTATAVFKRKYDFFTSPSNNAKKFGLNKYDLHFINCHGGPGEFDFFNSDDEPAIRTNDLDRQIRKGSVVAAECCFGAELPAGINRKLPMAFNYLEEGANGFVGSTSTSYGASNEDPSGYDADILTQLFMKYILEGRSAGSALQQARIDFKRDGMLDKGKDVLMSYKTLLQFYLLGDPSIHYRKVKNAAPKSVPKGVSQRRANAENKAKTIPLTKFKIKKLATAKASQSSKMQDILLQYKMQNAKFNTFEVTAVITKPSSAGQRGKNKTTSKKFTQYVALKQDKIGKGKRVKSYKALFINVKGTRQTVKYLVSR